MWLVDDLVCYPVIAIASALDHRPGCCATTWDMRLLSHWPPGSPSSSWSSSCSLRRRLCSCWHSSRWSWRASISGSPRQLRTREERESWQRLAADHRRAQRRSTSTAVLHVGGDPGRRALLGRRGRDRPAPRPASTGWSAARRSGVIYDGPGRRERPTGPAAITAELEAHDRSDQVGALRLRLPQPGHAHRVREVQAQDLRLRAVHRDPQRRRVRGTRSGSTHENAYAAAHDPLTGLANRRELLRTGRRVLPGQLRPTAWSRCCSSTSTTSKRSTTPSGTPPATEVLREVARRLDEAAAARRPGRPARRRRVRGAAGRPAHPGAGHAPGRRRCSPRWSGTIEVDGMQTHRRGGRRHRAGPRQRRRQRADAPRRRRHVPGQTRRPADRDVRARPGHRRRRPAHARRRAAPRGRRTRVRRRLPADRRPRHRRGDLGRGAGPLAPPGARQPDAHAVPARPWSAPASCPRSPTRCSTRR